MAMPAQTGETPVPKNKPTYADVYYTDAKDERQSLDIYLPRQSDGPAPVIVYIHGGAWTVGSKADVQQNSYDVHVLADNLLNSGSRQHPHLHSKVVSPYPAAQASSTV